MQDKITRAIAELAERVGGSIRIMEVCGTHTVEIFRHGIRSLLPGKIALLSGPGCPVCVTPAGHIEAAIALARRKPVVLATFGDMMRVPGKERSLGEVRAEGADIRVVYSPIDALRIAEQAPDREVVFFATGFETTAPLVAATLHEAERRKVGNFSIVSAHKLVPPALKALVAGGEVQIDGFLLPGHVCTITGTRPYEFLPREQAKAAVVTGFGASDILTGIYLILRQLESKRLKVEIQYRGVVHEEGNPRAREIMGIYFEEVDAVWRGIGAIPQSGLGVRAAYAHRDAIRRFGVDIVPVPDPPGCQCGAVLKGVITPPDCRLFAKACSPDRPVGPCMVSTEGSCAAYYRYAIPR